MPLVESSPNGEPVWAIYVGKAVPKGARTGGFGLDAQRGAALFARLKDHGKSIAAADNLDLKDFSCRFLSVDDIWIPLGESLLIERLNPLWNRVVDGFGNHDPGAGRHAGKRSAWDVLHPGRSFAKNLAEGTSEAEILDGVTRFFDVQPPPPLGPSIA